MGGDLPAAHVKARFDESLLYFSDLIFWIWFAVRLRSFSLFALSFIVVMLLGRHGTFNLSEETFGNTKTVPPRISDESSAYRMSVSRSVS